MTADVVILWMESLLEHGWTVKTFRSYRGILFEWRDENGCSGSRYQATTLRAFPPAVQEWIEKQPHCMAPGLLPVL